MTLNFRYPWILAPTAQRITPCVYGDITCQPVEFGITARVWDLVKPVYRLLFPGLVGLTQAPRHSKSDNSNNSSHFNSIE